MPPSLAKKRPNLKWSMGRRRSSYEVFDGDMRTDLGDGVIIPHSQRDEFSRNEY
jgi:hypothetical protein